MPIVQIASTALHDANDALLGVHCITRITRPHFHCFSDPRFGALSPTKAPGSPSQIVPLAALTPHTPLTHFVRSKSSILACRLAFVIYEFLIVLAGLMSSFILLCGFINLEIIPNTLLNLSDCPAQTL